MCFILLLHRVHPDYPVIVAANRDEQRSRPSLDPHRWDGNPTIWAGRDQVSGGTWLGVNEHGLLAAITNRLTSEELNPALPSRGLLCEDILRQQSLARAEISLAARLNVSAFNPFNLLCVDRNQAFVVASTGQRFDLEPGPHIVTNQGDPDDHQLARVRRGLELLARQAVDSGPLESVLSALAAICGDDDGPSPICRAGGERGTVSSSIIAIDAGGMLASYWHAAGPPCQKQHSYQTLPFLNAPASNIPAKQSSG